ncbi:MAG: hypothetical protein ACLFPS_07450 [Clostridia bacterium]
MTLKDKKIKMDKKLTIYCFAPAILFLLAAISFAYEGSYNRMAIATGGAILGPAIWMYQRDLMKVREDYTPNIPGITRIISTGIMLVTFGLAWFSNFQVISSVLLVAAFGQYWFVENPSATQRFYHGLISAGVGVWGYIYYRPVAYVFIPISFFMAFDYLRKQKSENTNDNKKGKKTKNKKKK